MSNTNCIVFNITSEIEHLLFRSKMLYCQWYFSNSDNVLFPTFSQKIQKMLHFLHVYTLINSGGVRKNFWWLSKQGSSDILNLLKLLLQTMWYVLLWTFRNGSHAMEYYYANHFHWFSDIVYSQIIKGWLLKDVRDLQLPVFHDVLQPLTFGHLQ